MSMIYIFGPQDDSEEILAWLSEAGGIAAGEVAAIVDPGAGAGSPERRLSGVPLVAMEHTLGRLTPDDIVIVAGEDAENVIEALFRRNIYNVYDGDAVIRRRSVAQRFLAIGEPLYLGPAKPAHLEPDRLNSRRYFTATRTPEAMPCHTLFVVNSMPKSGTVWMMTMVAAVLGVDVDRQLVLSHVRDIENHWAVRTVHGAVALVRDMRDVVVSWFHHLGRTDIQNGFAAPRYARLEEFYYEYFVGQITGSPRYYHGDLSKWLDFIGLNSIPVVRYEDMRADTHACLHRLMTFWKIDVTERILAEVAHDYQFDRMARMVPDRPGRVADMLKDGHLHRGRIGGWRDELPSAVAEDINQRFRDYQQRLRYL